MQTKFQKRMKALQGIEKNLICYCEMRDISNIRRYVTMANDVRKPLNMATLHHISAYDMTTNSIVVATDYEQFWPEIAN